MKKLITISFSKLGLRWNIWSQENHSKKQEPAAVRQVLKYCLVSTLKKISCTFKQAILFKVWINGLVLGSVKVRICRLKMLLTVEFDNIGTSIFISYFRRCLDRSTFWISLQRRDVITKRINNLRQPLISWKSTYLWYQNVFPLFEKSLRRNRTKLNGTELLRLLKNF